MGNISRDLGNIPRDLEKFLAEAADEMVTVRVGSRDLDQECDDAVEDRFNVTLFLFLETDIDRSDDVIQIIHKSTVRDLFNICTQFLQILSQFGALEQRLSGPMLDFMLSPDPMLVDQ